MVDETVIKLENVSKTFFIKEKDKDTIREKVLNVFSKEKRFKELQALSNINLEIKKGDFLGILGHNGSGKSTLLKIIIGAYSPDKGGKIFTKGRINRLALGTGFDPNLSARDNIYLNGTILGLTFKEIGKEFHNILEFAELQNFVDTPIKFFSRGMISRLSFSIAMNTRTDIFLIDEFFGGVGDIGFRKKSRDVFESAFLANRTIVFVSHNLSLIEKFCKRVLVLKKGNIIAEGSPEEIIPIYKKEYKK